MLIQGCRTCWISVGACPKEWSGVPVQRGRNAKLLKGAEDLSLVPKLYFKCSAKCEAICE